jgi:DNA-binding response OmpR family regulator
MTQKNVLVVDDEVDFAAFVKEVSLRMGDIAEMCHSAQEARLMLDSFAPDVIVLDIVMPGEDGIEFLRWLAANNYQPRIVLVTGFNPRYAEMAETLGKVAGLDISAVITKPVRAATLREALT